MAKGIDYGLGMTNIDHQTGIRYGVISQHEVLQAWADSSEADYGAPCCPHCGNEAAEYDADKHADYVTEPHNCDDYACDDCRISFDLSNDCSEPLGFTYDGEGYLARCGQDGDIFIMRSPYFTRAAYCSPCAPGACYLTSPVDDGERAYCFSHDWFDGGRAPYPVYSVETGELVAPAAS